MRHKMFAIAVLKLIAGLPAWGQESNLTGDVFATYSNFNIDGGNLIPRHNLNGCSLGSKVNFNKYLGLTV